MKILKLRGAPPPEPPTNPYDKIFLIIGTISAKNSIKLFKKIEKIAKIPLELSKNRRFPLIFLLRFPKIR